ncbi:hypothetical protein CFC21_053772 [Triticum aestivum]|uniref:Phospholipase A1 n=2 Tax=Triticum aestivum TaxID=4565 RepID=A0A9R1K894_WHEAT|nr:phospholipase A1-II 7-like [Triticum aestivum]KAF7044560.1 hypothetical protein CFC21_053769 [Triticum aestivum]KAF7044561.1 hypothetical protein CFC21_053770 [Triticum aestivum]KAF7044563.1 hypothetical protein CFC21_053772 [Triticum aestivum]
MSSPMKPGVVGSIASRWRELHGARSWAGLLDPLDADLREFLISYGELASASYDGFNNEERSPHRGACVYSRADVLAASTVSHPEYYSVTKFLYAASGRPDATGPLESNWMGFVAVATDEGVAAMGRRDIAVAWRGSVLQSETANDGDILQVSAAPVLGSYAATNAGAMVHRGFLSVYTSSDRDSMYNKASARDQVLEEVRRLMELHKDEVTSITVTGHSLGASLAILNTVDMVANSINVPLDSSKQLPRPVTAIMFASPQVGNNKFKSAFASFRDLHAIHVKNAPDIIPTLPGPLLGYVDVATATVPINTNRSPYLYPNNRDTYHNLECYLHGVAGDKGDGMDFKLVVDRDVALVNKKVNVLKDQYPVPANWYVAKNKWMVKGTDGHWKLDDFKEV